MLDAAFGPISTAAPLLPHPINQGRVLWLYGAPPLDGGRQWYDLCGLRHGTTVGAPAWVATGRGDSGLTFGGSSQYVSAPALASTAQALTLAAWVRTTTPTGFTWQIAVEFSGASRGANTFSIGVSDVANGNRWLATAATAGKDVLGQVAVAGWHRLVGVLSASGTRITLYVNGVQQATSTVTTVTVGTASGRVGQNTAGGDPWTGSIADVSVLPRALSAAEVRADFDLSRRGYPGVLRRALG